MRDDKSAQALSDDQYRLLEPFIPPPGLPGNAEGGKPGGSPRTTDLRCLFDGLFYIVRTGCQWCHLPPVPAFPPWQTVYGYFRTFLAASVWESMRHGLVTMLREQDGCEPSPSAAIIDTQSRKRGYGAGDEGEAPSLRQRRWRAL